MESPSPSPPTSVTKDGVVVTLLESAPWSHIVYVDRETGPLLVPPEAFFDDIDREQPISKSQSQRQHLGEKLFTIGSNVRVTFERESRIVRQAVRNGKLRHVLNTDHNVLHRTRVVLAPEGYAPTRKCWTEHFDEIGLSDHFAEKLHMYQENVLYEGEVRVHVELVMTADGICSGVDCDYSLWDICKVKRLSTRNTTDVDIVNTEVRHEFVRHAPWNNEWRDTRQQRAAEPYDSDDDYVPQVTSRPLKDYELIEEAQGFIVDYEVKTAFCPALPDHMVLLAESKAERDDRYYIGRWIKMDVYFSRVRDAWIAISAYDGYLECMDLTQNSRLKHMKKSKPTQALAADPQELLGRMDCDEVLVWARLASVGRAAHFVVEGIVEEVSDPPYIEEMASESGIYLGGAERVIFCKKRPFARFILPWCFDDRIQPGANIDFFAMKVMLRPRENREYVWLNTDVNFVEDPNHVLGSADGSTQAGGRSAWIVPHPSRVYGSAFFIVHSQDRPQE
ncbi:hypothetical protein AAVH_33242, partial [Aphelenchoides avenae]